MTTIRLIFFLLFLQIQCVAFGTKPFRFALFADLHISTSHPIPAEDLQRAVADVNTLQDIDFVLVAGDVTNSGDTFSLRKAKQLLQALKMPFYVVPGNHDFYWNVRVGTTDFIRIFGDNKVAFTHNGVLVAGFTTVPQHTSGNAYIQQADIDWLKSTLTRVGISTPAIILTHYPLLAGDVDNWKEMTNMLKTFNVKAVLNGHYHRNVLLDYNGIPGIVNRSVQRGKSSVGGYSIFSVSDTLKVAEKRIGKREITWLELPIETK